MSSSCSRRFVFAMHLASCDIRRYKRHGEKDHANFTCGIRRYHRTHDLPSSDSSIRRFSEDKDGHLLKQIMPPVEWPSEKFKDVGQRHHHWLDLVSKYEALCGEKVTDTVRITLALQAVKGNPPQSLNVTASDATTWSQAHSHLINYFNNATSQGN